MWFVFFTALIVTAACSVIFIKHYNRKMPKELEFFAGGMTLVLALAGISELFFDFDSFNGTFLFMGAIAVAEYIIWFFLQGRKSRTLSFMGKIILGTLIAELTFFQFPSYRILTGDYEYTMLSAADAEVEGGFFDPVTGGVLVKGIEETSLNFHNLDGKIGTVHVNVRFDDENTRQMSFFADMTEETGYYYRLKVIESTLIAESPYSQYSMVQLAGKTDSARFRFAGLYEDNMCVIESIELNKPIPFDVMPVRPVIFIILGTFLYACIFSVTMKKQYKDNKYFCRVAATWITILAVCCGVILVLQQIPKGEFFNRFRLENGDQITEELVVAFENGRFYFDAEPSPELLAMDNPYDNGTRFYNEIEYLWDHVYYEGKYYSYYGIAPLLLFIPYHLITGYFFPSDIAVMLFASVGLLILSSIYSLVVKKWFSRISTGTYISGLAILLASCGIWYSVGRPMFYELSISAGFMCLTAAAYFFITSGIFEKEPAKLPKIFLSSLLLGLSVMCRPTLAVYAVCGCILYLINIGKQHSGKKSKAVSYLASAFLPLVVLGSFQMYYNYARFGSVLEFGIKYSLTINDFTNTEYHVHNMLIGLYNFLLAPPAFIPDYPFVSAPFSFLGLNSYYFKDDGTISGILFLALPVFGYIFCGKALKKIKDKKKKLTAAVVVGLICIAMPVIIVCSVWESGYSARYMADFSWEVVTGAYLVLFFLYSRSENALKKRVFNAGMGICCVYTLIVVGIEAYVFTFPQLACPRYADILDRLLAFYK